MDIAIMPGATVAVVRIRINANVNGTLTKWKLYYKKSSESSYKSVSENYENDYFYCDTHNYGGEHLYGYGPLFYDLEGLDPNTEYDIYIDIIECDDNTYVNERQNPTIKHFQTCAEISEEHQFKFSTVTSTQSSTPQEYYDNVTLFEKMMNDVGYDYYITNQNSYRPMNGGVGPFQVSAIYMGSSVGANTGATSGFGIDVQMGPRYAELSVYVHEYRHVLGLSQQCDNSYHGDDSDGAGFARSAHRYPASYNYNQQYYHNICDVIEFARGFNKYDPNNPRPRMEIYQFYGENSVDSRYSGGNHYLDFFLLKALGLNDITIVY